MTTRTYKQYQRLLEMPLGLGNRVFSLAYMYAAPYFSTVRPQVQVMEPNRSRVRISKRWRVQNHIGTVHAIAAANGCEAAMGLLAEATVPQGQRWIPQGMELRYVAKSSGDLICTAVTDPADWEGPLPHVVPVRVQTALEDGTVTVEGTINIFVSEIPAKSGPVTAKTA